MPVIVKVIFSIVVLAVAVVAHFFLDWHEQSVSSYLALLFGALSVGSFWLFPEVIRGKGK